MKSKKLFKAIGGIDDNFISEQAERLSPARKINSYTPAKAKRHVWRPFAAAATAAALALCFVFGGMLLPPASGNFFEVKAYAMEQYEDGTVGLSELDFTLPGFYVDEGKLHFVWGGYSDGVNTFANIQLKCEGENIEHVDFYTEDGFFATQRIKMENGVAVTEGVPALFVGENHTLALYPKEEFDILGGAMTLGMDEMTDDLLIFLGARVEDGSDGRANGGIFPESMTIRAVATFNDGSTQEKTLTLDFSGEGVLVLSPSAGYANSDEAPIDEALINGITLKD